jgi:dipeptidase D
MVQGFQNLYPDKLWFYFNEILMIPRPSKSEEKILNYILEFGKRFNLETIQDETGNILIRKPASKGYEHMKSVVLQSHVDMVCEKNSDLNFNFNTDPIQAWIDNGWVKSKGTTLGADDGIGIAAQLAILEDESLVHGPIECLFTVDEETGLTGAHGLKAGFLKSDILLNLDSEDEGELFIGCAGGKDTVARMKSSKEPVPDNIDGFQIRVFGLTGGHSGDDIHKGRGNATKLLNRILWHSANEFGLRISHIDGGNLRNAIAREAFAMVTLPQSQSQSFIEYVKYFGSLAKAELKVTEPDLNISFEPTGRPLFLIDKATQKNLIHSVYACPHGVITWSADIPNFVETSTNLASIKFKDDTIIISTSQRSSVESAKEDICNMVASVFILAGAEVKHSDGYPGWKPNSNSDIVEITRKAYNDLFHSEPQVKAIHAGLECGLIGHAYPSMDMISFGPTIKGAHSPDERLEISSVTKFWELTIEVLKRIPEAK